MARPNNALLYTLAVVGIVPEHAYGPGYGEHPIGSGRYMLEEWKRGEQVILRANPDYYGEKPLMERVVVVFMEEDASLAAASAGSVDVAYTSAPLAGNVPASLGAEIAIGSIDETVKKSWGKTCTWPICHRCRSRTVRDRRCKTFAQTWHKGSAGG